MPRVDPGRSSMESEAAVRRRGTTMTGKNGGGRRAGRGGVFAVAFLALAAGCSGSAGNNGIVRPPPSPVQSVAFTLDGTLVAAGVDTTVKLWDPATGNERA